MEFHKREFDKTLCVHIGAMGDDSSVLAIRINKRWKKGYSDYNMRICSKIEFEQVKKLLMALLAEVIMIAMALSFYFRSWSVVKSVFGFCAIFAAIPLGLKFEVSGLNLKDYFIYRAVFGILSLPKKNKN